MYNKIVVRGCFISQIWVQYKNIFKFVNSSRMDIWDEGSCSSYYNVNFYEFTNYWKHASAFHKRWHCNMREECLLVCRLTTEQRKTPGGAKQNFEEICIYPLFCLTCMHNNKTILVLGWLFYFSDLSPVQKYF